MQVPLQVSFHGLDPSNALEQRVRHEVDRLERVFGRITACRVVVEVPHSHHRKGRLFRVVVDLKVPGADLVVERATGDNHAHEDPFVAVRDAFVAARRQLQEHTEKHR